MTSPQTISRRNKREMLKTIMLLAMDMYNMPLKDINALDIRNIKKIVAEMESWQKSTESV